MEIQTLVSNDGRDVFSMMVEMPPSGQFSPPFDPFWVRGREDSQYNDENHNHSN